MDDQTRYDAVLVAIPVFLAVGWAVTAVSGGPRGLAAGSVAASVAVGAALFSRPPTRGQDV